MRRATFALVCALLLSIGLLAPTDAGAQATSLTIAVNCASNPERVTITNNLATTLNVVNIGSLDDPRANEPFFLPNSGTPFQVAVGGSITYTSGSNASGNVLTRQFIFDDEEAGEGVRVSIGPEFITGQNGPLTFQVLCSQGSRTFTFDGTTTPTMPNTGGGGMVDADRTEAGTLALFGALLAGGAVAYRRKASSC